MRTFINIYAYINYRIIGYFIVFINHQGKSGYGRIVSILRRTIRILKKALEE